MNTADPSAERLQGTRQRGRGLSDLSRFEGGAQAFWEAYFEAVGSALRARRALLLALVGDQPWQAHAQWPEVAQEDPADVQHALRLASRALQGSPVVEDHLAPGSAGDAIAIRLETSPVAHADATVLVIWVGPGLLGAAGLPALFSLAEMAAAVPSQWDRSRQSSAVPATAAPAVMAERIYEILQLSIGLADETRFMRAALSLCNDLAVRFQADRVSMGWVEGDYVKLVAMSHVENFDRRASASRELEDAMEESWKQDSELAWPDPEGDDRRRVSRAHEIYARSQGCGHLLSVLLRTVDRAVGVLTLDRRSAAFTAEEIFEIRLVAESAARPLAHLRDSDRWFGSRLLSRLRRWRAELLGPAHVAWKLAGAAAAMVVAALAFVPWTYWIDTTLTLRGKDVLFVPAPFDGFLRQVNVEVGDVVREGAVMVELDTRELVLEESMAVADEMRLRREVEKSQAVRQFADMQIALARQQQSASKLGLIRHQLQHAQIRAPFVGVVVEGELKKNLGAPVRKGDMLLKLASTGQMVLELEIDQADIHEVSPGMAGEFALIGRPDQRYPIVVERIDPVSTQREGRNVFVARARTDIALQAWWRPGMGGAARLDAGPRSLLWIMTHRTVRFVRHALWL